jgi:hypothetical protein
MQTTYHHIPTPRPRPIAALSDEESSEIRRTLGATPIYVLRQSYGAGFAPGTPGDITLGQAMDRIDNSSMTLLVRRLHRGGDDLNRI